MSRHAADWRAGRIFSDKFIGRSTPGKHHPIWDVDVDKFAANPSLDECPWCEKDRLNHERGLQPTPYGGMEDRAGFAALAKEVS